MLWRVCPLFLLCSAPCGVLSTGQDSHEEALQSRQDELEAQVAELRRLVMEMPEQAARQLTAEVDAPAADALQAALGEANARIVELATCLDHIWLLICAALVMLMQAGFALLESGSCRAKNAGMVLTKNVMDALIGTVVWYSIGYGFAYGVAESPNKFIGTQNFGGKDFWITDSAGEDVRSNHFKDWFFQWTFCATTTTIVSGAVAERIRFEGYVIYALVMTGFIYPTVVWWTWSGFGFLTEMGYSDFAGSGIVHFTGGISALVGAVVIGARKNRWDSKSASRFDPHNMSLVVLGTFILWFGWYGFNCGSTLAFSDSGTATQAAMVAMNTTLAAALGGLTIFLMRWRCDRGVFDLAGTCNGILVGLVAVCAGVGDVDPHMAVLIGIAGGLAHEAGSNTLKKLKVDDPCDAFAVHGCGGVIGVLLRPLLDRTGADAEMFGVHCLALLCIGAWAGGLSFITFKCLMKAGILRVDQKEEIRGADEHCAQQHAYQLEDEEDAEEKRVEEAKMQESLNGVVANESEGK